jgi:LmbE family N-acetylglucosaminyl deacetylase
MKQDAFDTVFSDIQSVMVVMPHPDDTELYCGGTLARLISKGIEVICIKMTNGGKGTKQTDVSEKELTAKRSEDDKRAALALGVKPENNIQLNIPDGEVNLDLSNIEKLAFYFRKFRPDMLITCNPEDVIIRFAEGSNWVNHRDHRHTAQLAVDAAYPYSRDTAFFPKHLTKISSDYKPVTLFLFSDYYDHPDLVYIDITDHLEAKAKAWRCHETAYTPEQVDSSIEFLNRDGDTSRYYEAFRFVIAD